MDKSNSFTILKHRNLILWFLLMVSLIEWGAYFIQITLHFYDFYHVTFTDQLKIGSFLFSPIIYGIMVLVFKDKNENLTRIIHHFFPFILIGWITINLLYYFAFYQYYGLGSVITVGFLTDPMLYGMMGSLTDSTQNLFELNLMYTYLLLVPCIIIMLTHGGKGIHLSDMAIWSAGLFSLYMILRFGGFAGVPLRVGCIGIIALVFWLLPISEFEIQNNIKNLFPSTKLFPVFIVLAFIWSAPAYTSSGLMHENWIWFGGVIGFIMWKIISIKMLPEFRIKTGKISIIGLILIFILLIGTNLNLNLRTFRPFLLMFGLLLSYWVTELNVYFENPSKSAFKQWIGIIFLFCYTNLMVIMPFLSGASNPITEILGIMLLAFSGIFLLKKDKKSELKSK